jgi:hypothetical protein
MLRTYVGTKIVQAEPDARLEGDMVELGYRVVYPDGYVSWSPKAVFDNAYRLVTPEEADFIRKED